MSDSETGYRSNGRPQSTLAMSFSNALDEMFKLSGVGALELSVEQKKSEVQHQEKSLEDLDARLREATERLKELEAKHKRQSQIYASRPHARHIFRMSDTSGSEDGGGGGGGGSSNGSDQGWTNLEDDGQERRQ